MDKLFRISKMAMKTVANLTLTVIFSVVIGSPVNAQQCSQGGMFIGGKFMQCPGQTCVDPNLHDLAYASGGRIRVHPALLNFPPAVQQFVYAHECAHILGVGNEQDADCRAVIWGKQAGAITPFDLGEICQSVYFNPGDWTHFPGPARCQLMVQCYWNN